MAESEIIVLAWIGVEALTISAGRNVGVGRERLLGETGLQIVPLTEAAACRLASAYFRWGKGFYAARLNNDDCFAYEVAKHHGCRLPCLGNDFSSKTDLVNVL